MNVNYIKHLEAFYDKACLDDRLSTQHIGVYYGLFHLWNQNKFNNPISINRSELMLITKIGSANTYTRCLKELNAWGYIEYLPSFNPARGSLINLYRFDNGCDNRTDTARDKGGEMVVRPSINSINKKKQIKPLKLVRRRESEKLSKTEARTGSSNSRGNDFESSIPPAIDEIKEFFLQEESLSSEAENFFNYFESNGWLVGGKAKMKNWKAAAKNWIKRSSQFKKPPSQAQSRLHTNNDKDYSIPL